MNEGPNRKPEGPSAITVHTSAKSHDMVTPLRPKYMTYTIFLFGKAVIQ